jgi:hypothetical protein
MPDESYKNECLILFFLTFVNSGGFSSPVGGPGDCSKFWGFFPRRGIWHLWLCTFMKRLFFIEMQSEINYKKVQINVFPKSVMLSWNEVEHEQVSSTIIVNWIAPV